MTLEAQAQLEAAEFLDHRGLDLDAAARVTMAGRDGHASFRNVALPPSQLADHAVDRPPEDIQRRSPTSAAVSFVRRHRDFLGLRMGVSRWSPGNEPSAAAPSGARVCGRGGKYRGAASVRNLGAS